MSLHVYNTLGRKKNDFVPLKQGQINFFVCGPTVYDYAHIGHGRSYVVYDVIVKYLRSLGFTVRYVQNITDVDDKIIVRAAEEKKTAKEIAEHYEKTYHEDMLALGVTAVTKYARATNYISEIINQIERLIKTGHAYLATDGVYFDISSFLEYGKLSNQKLEELKVQRIEPNPAKKNLGDFSLWKKHKQGEPSWDSQFGKGRPGWHIEDTAITETEFGSQYDVHGGGMDLIFPHHEAEIAQMEALSGKPLAKYWLHNGFLQVNGEKMSKSLKNFTTIRDSLKKFPAAALRYFFLSTHYRSPINYTDEGLRAAANAVERLNETIHLLKLVNEKNDEETHSKINDEIQSLQKKFTTAMNDDFETSRALGAVFEFVRTLNSSIATKSLDIANAREALGVLKNYNEILGVMNFKDEQLSSEQKSLIEEREVARKKKDWTLADTLRKKLLDTGILVEDAGNRSTWKRV